jgi:hypothetical protein
VQKLLKIVFDIKYLYKVIPVLLLIIYGPGVIIAFFRLGPTANVLEFLSIFLVSLAVYFLFYYYLRIIMRRKLVVDKGLSVINIANFLFTLYFIYILYTVITAPGIPLLLSLKGASSSELSYYRELFFKARTGFDGILVYLNAIFTVALLPYIVATLYIIKYKFRHLYLLFFIFTLLLSMEKSLIARALLPLLVLVINGIVVDKYLTLKNILLICTFGLLSITFLTLGNLSSDETQLLSEVVEIDPNAAKYFVVNNPDSVFMFIFNRIFWIPYITAIDWLAFFNEELNRQFVMGASSSAVASVFGMDRINLERLVFEFEWGQNESGTGSANTVYFIDIFLNFGWIGVILSNIILAFIVRFLEFCNNNAAKATFFVYAYFIATSTLIGVMFSSGLLIFLFLLLFVKKV